MPSEGYGTYLVLVVLVLSILLALLLVSTLLFIIGLVVYVLLACPTLDLLFALILLTVLTPVVQTLLVTTVCMALLIVSLLQITLPLVTYLQRSHSTHIFIPHFSHSEPEAIVSAAVCLQFYIPLSLHRILMAISEDDCQIHTLKTAPGQPLPASQKCRQESPQHL